MAEAWHAGGPRVAGSSSPGAQYNYEV